jgi:hypothetical protein
MPALDQRRTQSAPADVRADYRRNSIKKMQNIDHNFNDSKQLLFKKSRSRSRSGLGGRKSRKARSTRRRRR